MNDESQGRNIIVVMCFLFLYVFIKCVILGAKVTLFLQKPNVLLIFV